MDVLALDYTDRLRRLANNDGYVPEGYCGEAEPALGTVDPKTRELVRLAALVAVGGSAPSYGALADAAVSAGATAAELIDVLFCIIPVVGLPRVVAAASNLAMALGYDTDDASEDHAADR